MALSRIPRPLRVYPENAILETTRTADRHWTDVSLQPRGRGEVLPPIVADRGKRSSVLEHIRTVNGVRCATLPSRANARLRALRIARFFTPRT